MANDLSSYDPESCYALQCAISIQAFNPPCACAASMFRAADILCTALTKSVCRWRMTCGYIVLRPAHIQFRDPELDT